jgi:hypothetical protein
MMNPDEYFALFYRARPIDESTHLPTVKASPTSAERLSGGCLLYRLPIPRRLDTESAATDPTPRI